MKHIIYILFLSVIIFTSCRDDGNVTSIPDTPVSFKTITTDSIIGLAGSIHRQNDTCILINDLRGEPMIKCFNIGNGRLTSSAVRAGQGPGEIIPPIRVTTSEDSIYVLSLSTKALYSSAIDSIRLKQLATLPLEAMKLYYLPGNKIFIAPVIHIGGINIDPDLVAYVYDQKINQRQELKGFARLWTEEKDLGDDILSMFHQVRDIIEIGNRIAVLETHVLRLYEYDGKTLSHIKDVKLAPYAYVYKKNDGRSTSTARLEQGYQLGAGSMTVVDGKILIAFNNEIKGHDGDEKVTLRLYDTNGNQLENYIPDMKLSPSPMCRIGNDIIMISEQDDDVKIAVARLDDCPISK